VLRELLVERKLLPAFEPGVDVFVLIEDENLRVPSLKLVNDLRAGGASVEYAFTPAKADRQFKRAQELKANFTAKVENDMTGRLRNLKTREEKLVPLDQVAQSLRG
jgi:histidyl-tRNA synthetase